GECVVFEWLAELLNTSNLFECWRCDHGSGASGWVRPGAELDAIVGWWPAYHALGSVKLATALISLALVAVLPLIPRVLRVPELARINAALEHEIAERKEMETWLR